MRAGLLRRVDLFDPDHVGPALPQTPARFVDRDPCQPGEDIRLTAKPGDRAEGAYIGLLQYVLGLVIVTHDAARDAKQTLVAPGHDRAERLAVAGLGAMDELFVAQGGMKGGVGPEHVDLGGAGIR